MGGKAKTRFELKNSHSDTIINNQFSQKIKLLGIGKSNCLIIILTLLWNGKFDCLIIILSF